MWQRHIGGNAHFVESGRRSRIVAGARSLPIWRQHDLTGNLGQRPVGDGLLPQQEEAHQPHGRDRHRHDGAGPDLAAAGAVAQDRAHLHDPLVCQAGAGRVGS